MILIRSLRGLALTYGSAIHGIPGGLGPWLKYLTRNQYMLQQGEFVGDVLCYAGESAPLDSGHFHRGAKFLNDLPYSYDYSMCNTEILMQLTVKDGRLLMENGVSFRVLSRMRRGY